MLYNPMSLYPKKVDDMTFFQDTNIEKIEIINQYNTLITQGKYSEASDYINKQSNVYGFFAVFFNFIENKIYNLQEYLLQKPSKKQPFIYYDEEEYFASNDLHVFTDTDEEEDISSIFLFSDDNNDNEDSIDRLFYFTGVKEVEPTNINKGTIWI